MISFRGHPSDEELVFADGGVSAHLSSCAECRERRASQLAISRIIERLPVHTSPPGWQHKVLECVKPRRRPTARSSWPVTSAIMHAVAAGIASGVWIRPKTPAQRVVAVVDLGLAPMYRCAVTPILFTCR